MKKMTTEKCGLQAKIDFLKGDFETRQNDLSDNYNDQIKKLQDENCSLKKGLNKISKNYEVLHKKKIKIEYKEVPFKSKHSDVENPYSASCFICYNDVSYLNSIPALSEIFQIILESQVEEYF
jgi:predicted nuclease with TOPRIM domain